MCTKTFVFSSPVGKTWGRLFTFAKIMEQIVDGRARRPFLSLKVQSLEPKSKFRELIFLYLFVWFNIVFVSVPDRHEPENQDLQPLRAMSPSPKKKENAVNISRVPKTSTWPFGNREQAIHTFKIFWSICFFRGLSKSCNFSFVHEVFQLNCVTPYDLFLVGSIKIMRPFVVHEKSLTFPFPSFFEERRGFHTRVIHVCI